MVKSVKVTESRNLEKTPNITFSRNHQTAYCEHLLRFALGPSVSKLEFGLVNDLQEPSVAEITNSIVIPTEKLIEVIPLIIAQLENPNIKKGLIKKLENIKEAVKDFKYDSSSEELSDE